MRVVHVKPEGWADTEEPGVIQPSHVAGMAHQVELEEGDLLRGPQGEPGPQGLPGPNVAGMVAFFARATAPAGWLVCDGSLVLRAAYPALFAAVGVVFGAGDGVSTFALPDLRGEFVRGLDGGRGVDVGRVLGSSQLGGNAAHSHGAGTLTASSAGGHTHSYGAGMELFPGGPGLARSSNFEQAVSSVGGDHTHSVTGSTGSHGGEARPRNVALLPCIAVGV